MTFLVTGACGFLGSHVVDVLAEEGRAVRVLVLPGEQTSRLLDANVEIFTGDIRDRTAVAAATAGVDYVIHCAALTGPWGSPEAYVSTNVDGLGNIIREALSAGVRRVVHVSSVTVHGNDVGGRADENTRFKVEPNVYSRSKVAAEILVRRLVAESSAPVSVVRPGWIYGPRDVGSFARFASMAEAGRLVVIGDGSNQVPLIYVRDAARGAVQAALTEAAPGREYLLVNDEPVRQLEFLSTIASAVGAEPPSRHVPYRAGLAAGFLAETVYKALRRESAPPLTRYGVQMLGGDNRFDVSRARAELGFDPEFGVRTGVAASADWYRSEAGAEREVSV